MSTVETVPRRFFRFTVAQVQANLPVVEINGPRIICQDDLPLVVRLFKQIQSRSAIDGSVTVSELNLVDQKGFLLNYANVKRLCKRTAYTTLLIDTLSSVGVPQVEQPAIVQKFFCLVDETAVPELYVDVAVTDITEFVSENSISVDDDESILIDTVARESMETHRARLKPASKSSIEGLEKLRLLDHSLELQAVIEHTPSCPICMEPLDCPDAAAAEDEEEEEEEEEEVEVTIPTAKGKSQEDEARPKQKRKREEEETRPKKRRINEEAIPRDERNYEEDKEEEEEEAIPQQTRKSKQKEAGDDDHTRMIMITRMPCLHHYHVDCIVHWLEINHVCPMCRYPMPIAETSEASQPS